MSQYISKSDVVTEIERRLDVLANTSAGDNKEFAAIIGAQQYELINLAQYINTLEVKEVDLEEEVKCILNQYYYFPKDSIDIPTVIRITAKNFFELGLKAQKG